jgi:hypothetical protein
LYCALPVLREKKCPIMPNEKKIRKQKERKGKIFFKKDEFGRIKNKVVS